MTDTTSELVGFAYGEDREDGSGRSLGYRLLAPLPPADWSGEVEGLARRLQAAPYPDPWPACDLFCSILLADGRRVVALARYGLSDHTPTPRRGGLELVGVVTPGGLGVDSALTLYRWLKRRRAVEEDLHRLGGTWNLAEVLAAAHSTGDAGSEDVLGPVPILPVRLWQQGAFLFAAANPSDPDLHLRLLDVASTPRWQWLPLIGPDLPLAAHAQRGPLVAWTAHLAGVAVKFDRSERVSEVPVAVRGSRLRGGLVLALVGVLLGLLAGNLWYLERIRVLVATAITTPVQVPVEGSKTASKPGRTEEETADRFARALYDLLSEKGVGEREWTRDRVALLDRYEGLVRRHPALRLGSDGEQGKMAVAVTSLLASRSGPRVEESIRKALKDKGFSDRLIDVACEYVREQLAQESRDR